MAIQDNNWLYSLLRYYVDCTYRMAYSKVEYVGIDKIPEDGAVILAPNHTNALMDALTVLTAKHSPTVFVARADIFRNPKIARVLDFFKIMPIMRMRDGRENLKKNEAIMRKAVEVLEAGVPFCIFSEGTHRMMHSLLPLSKGIFRIALQCDSALAGKKPVYIVPIGIEYGSYTRYCSSLMLQVGQPINVSDFIVRHSGLEQPELIMALRNELSVRMADLFHYVKDDDDYEAVLDYCYLKNREVLESQGLKPTPYNVMKANRHTVEMLDRMKTEEPDDARVLLDVMREFAVERRKAGIEDESLYDRPSAWSRFTRIMLLIVSLPCMVLCSIINAPIALLQWVMLRRLDDMAFYNSFRFVIVLVLMPVILIITAVVAACYLPWYGVLAVLACALPANVVVNYYVKAIRIIRSDCRLKKLVEKSGRFGKLFSYKK